MERGTAGAGERGRTGTLTKCLCPVAVSHAHSSVGVFVWSSKAASNRKSSIAQFAQDDDSRIG